MQNVAKGSAGVLPIDLPDVRLIRRRRAGKGYQTLRCPPIPLHGAGSPAWPGPLPVVQTC